MPKSNPAILLVDDEPNLLFGLAAIMKRAGYEVLTAGDGAEGMCLARTHLPALILCDVMMPAMSGFELRQALGRLPETAAIPFIFLTARTNQTDKLIGLESGADDYVTKPFNREELLARVKAVLRRNELGRQQGFTEAEAQLNKLNGEISQNLSHELRTPLGVVLTTLEVTLNERFVNTPEDREQFIKMALNNANRLHSLVEDLIALNEIDSGQASFIRQPVDLDFEFKQPVEQLLEFWREKRLDVQQRLHPNVYIAAPRNQFKRTVLHLLDNACKFSPEGGRVEVELAANGHGGFVYTVSDHGPGIPLELREKVFARYFQASQGVNRSYGGLGLGLAIARAFARCLGGEVDILDAETGCRVQMTIPPLPADWETADAKSTAA